MTEEYEDIVRQWYVRLRTPFLYSLTKRYRDLSWEDAENLYQDTSLASGHGQHVLDINGDEPTGYDEAMVPYDACRYA